MPAIFDHHRKVLDHEIDELGHVNNVEYLRWMQDAAMEHSSVQGWPVERYFELGAGWVARSHHIEYFSPALPNDEIVVRTWVANFQKLRSLRRFKILRRADETLLAEGETTWVFIQFQKRQPCRVPDQVRDAFIIVQNEVDPQKQP